MDRYEKKIYYVTQAQYNILKENGTINVGGVNYSGIDPDATYFVRPIPDNYELVWDNEENQIQLINGAESGDPITIQYASYAANAGSLGGSSADDFVNIDGEQTITGSKTFSSIISGSISGNAGTATKLANARTIGGVSFDGSANINLPGVNTSGNQNTTGNAGTATKLATARTIGGVSFDGSANINLPGVNTAGNQNTTGNAGSATKLQTARLFTVTDNDGTNSQNASSSFDGSGPYTIKLPSTIKATLSGNATTATTLQTARTIALGTGAVGTATSFNGSSNITIPVTGVSESYLTWGGKNLNGQVSPIGMSLSNEHSANRLAFINGDSLYFEYSSNGGSTWTDYGYNATTKSQFCTTSVVVPIGRTSGTTEYTTLSRTRITLTAQNGTTSYLYTNPRKMLLEISSSGGMQVLVETRTGTNYQSAGAWSTFGTYTLSGWSGWNDIPLVLATLGGGASQTGNNWQLRLTFIMTSKNADSPTTAQVSKLRIYGENSWGVPSTMAATNNLYSFDMSQNATFPGTITGTRLISNVAIGTAPFTVTSTTKVDNLNADLLDGQHGTYYQPASTAITTSNIGTQTVDKANKLTTARLFTVTDNDGTNSQNAATSFDGSSAYTIKLPSTIKANITGTASGNLTSSSTLDASKLSGTIPSAVLGNSTYYIGTTAVTLNRASASLALTGVTNTNWDSAYTHSTTTTGAVHGATTVGNNFFRLANPSVISFPRINADNTVSTLSASAFRAAIGAGTSSTTGTVTSVSGTGTVSGITLTGTVTSTGNLTLGGSISGLTTSNLSASAGIVNSQLANSSITVGTTAISLGSSSTTLTGLASVTSTTFTTGVGTQTWQISDATNELRFINSGTVILPKVSTGTKTIAFTDSVPTTLQITGWNTAANNVTGIIEGDVTVGEADYANRAGAAPAPIGASYAGTTINLTTADANKFIRVTHQGSATTVNLSLAVSNAMAIGDEIHISRSGTLDVTISVGSGLTLRSLDSKVKIAGQYGVVTLKKITSTEWYLFGALK